MKKGKRVSAVLATGIMGALISSASIAQAGWTWSYSAWGQHCYDNVSYLSAHGEGLIGSGLCGGSEEFGITHIHSQSGVAANTEDVSYQTKVKVGGTWYANTTWTHGNQGDNVNSTTCRLGISYSYCRIRSGQCTGTGCPI